MTIKTKFLFIAAGFYLLIACSAKGFSQTTDKTWSLNDCIRYALEKNIQIQQTQLTSQKKEIVGEQAKTDRYPSVNASVSQNFGWDKTLDVEKNKYGDYSRSNSTGYSVNSSVTLFNGYKLKNIIKQSELEVNASRYDTQTTQENVSLNILNAYLQVLYSEELVKNSQKQIDLSEEQLRLAGERLHLGAISQADYLQVKSQLASEKLTLANAQSQLSINKVTLMQLMELPVASGFQIVHPDFGDSINQHRMPDAESIFRTALAIKPQIKSAELGLQSAQENVNITKAGFLPQLSLNGSLSTGYSSGLDGLGYGYQVENKINPSVGLSLSIPIYQNKQIRNQVQTANLEVQSATLNMSDTKNELRKSIEQACVDVTSAENEYEASREQYKATFESYQVSSEKFDQGLLSSVDFLIQKTNLIESESSLLQSKYKLIFSYKTLDFYSGIPLGL